MKEEKRTVALLFGGVGCERDVSISAAPYVYSLIDQAKYRIIPLIIEEGGELFGASFNSDGGFTKDKTAAHLYRMYGKGGVVRGGDFYPIDAAFPLLHGDGGEDGVVQGALEMLSIPYVGCDGYCGSVTMDKVYTKIIAESLSVPTAKFVSARLKEDSSTDKAQRHTQDKNSSQEVNFSHSAIKELIAKAECVIDYPMVVKPTRLGSSFGLSLANNSDELFCGIVSAAKCGDGRVLIEERVNIACEAEVAFFSAGGVRLISECGGIISDGLYDHSQKYEDTSKIKVTKRLDLPLDTAAKIREYSSSLADFFGFRHLSRIDFFVTADEKIVFNEINTMPGFTDTSLYPELLRMSGISPQWAVNAAIEDAIGG